MKTRMMILLFLIFLFTAIAFPAPAPTLAAAQKPTFTVTYMTKTVRLGEKARVVIKTEPGAKCMLKYKTPLGRVSKAQGVGRIKADVYGNCSWTWVIGTNTTLGKGQVIITVNKYTQMLPIMIQKR